VNRNSKYKIPACGRQAKSRTISKHQIQNFFTFTSFGNLDLGFIWDLEIEIWDL
jgi:hypothetical protein